MAPHSESLKLMRVVVREDFTRSRCDALIADFKLALDTLDEMDEKRIEEAREHVQRIQRTRTRTGFEKKVNSHFADEEHSLKGKHGKSHGVC
jgi:glutamate decarboxylase